MRAPTARARVPRVCWQPWVWGVPTGVLSTSMDYPVFTTISFDV
jgi:hypothetical protein